MTSTAAFDVRATELTGAVAVRVARMGALEVSIFEDDVEDAEAVVGSAVNCTEGRETALLLEMTSSLAPWDGRRTLARSTVALLVMTLVLSALHVPSPLTGWLLVRTEIDGEITSDSRRTSPLEDVRSILDRAWSAVEETMGWLDVVRERAASGGRVGRWIECDVFAVVVVSLRASYRDAGAVGGRVMVV